MDKTAWRRELLAKRATLPAAIRRRAGRVIATSVLSLPEMAAAKRVGLYADFRREVPTCRLACLLKLAGKEIALPVTDAKNKRLAFRRIVHRRQLHRGAYGILEPNPGCPMVPARALDLIVVPGVGFDRRGHRLGYGMGYYDRYLAETSPACIAVGLAYSFQVVPLLPHEPLDRRMDLVITEMEVIKAVAERGFAQ